MSDKHTLDLGNEEIRIGVYTCYCGGNISDVVACEKVAASLSKEPNIVVARTDMSMCSDAGQSMIQKDIEEKGINRVVIGACAPSLHEQTFRKTVQRAGLNPYLYHHVGIREQDSWVHHDDKEGATEKAITLMNAGIAKAHLLQPLEPIKLDAIQHALVIGGGIAGLRSALDIARSGIQVTLIEKSPFLGGHMAQLEAVFPTGENARESLHALTEKVLAHPDIKVYTQTELSSVRGYVGDFQVEFIQQSRGVSRELKNPEAVIAACPINVLDEYNYGLTTRKAIYQAYPGCYPLTPAIDWEHCTACGDCLQVSGGEIRLENMPQATEMNVGAIVVATGFDPYEPHPGEYGYSELPEVITLPQLIRLLALKQNEKDFTYNGHLVENIVLIHCAGSRQVPGVHEPQADGQVNDYCSRVCCTATLQAINELHERFPELNIFDLYEDIRTYGRGHEELYVSASECGARFLRFDAEDGPEILPADANEEHSLIVKARDHLTWGEEIEIPTDLVVLAVGMMPSPIEDLSKLLKISSGTDRFLMEVHPKLRPVETAVSGIVLAGTAQGPMNIQESCAAASAAASKVAILLGQGSVELDPFVAAVDSELCNGSGECVAVCPYEDAISLEKFSMNGQDVQRAVVSPANCVGCGACVSACPKRAIDLQGWTLGQYEAMVDAIAVGIPEMEGAA